MLSRKRSARGWQCHFSSSESFIQLPWQELSLLTQPWVSGKGQGGLNGHGWSWALFKLNLKHGICMEASLG